MRVTSKGKPYTFEEMQELYPGEFAEGGELPKAQKGGGVDFADVAFSMGGLERTEDEAVSDIKAREELATRGLKKQDDMGGI